MAPTFSASRSTLLVPGIGITFSRVSNQASASCAGVQPFVAAISRYAISERHVALEITALKPRIATTPIVRREIVKGPESPPEKATPKRTVRDQRDAQLSKCREKFVLRIAAEQRVFGLHSSDGMDAMCTPQCLRRHLRQAKMADLSLPHQIGHPAYRVLDGHFRVDTVKVVHVDVVHFEPAQ